MKNTTDYLQHEGIRNVVIYTDHLHTEGRNFQQLFFNFYYQLKHPSLNFATSNGSLEKMSYF